MPKRAGSDPEVRRKFDRLAALALDRPGRRDFAAELVRRESHPELLNAALAVLAQDPVESLAETLRERYAALDLPRKDPGGFVRMALVGAMRRIARPADALLFERAATTREPTPQDPAGPAVLRAAGLVALNDVDDRRARLVAVRVLQDAKGVNSDEATVAVRVLAANGETALLYHLVLSGKGLAPEAAAECVRGLADVPADLLRPVAATLLRESDGLALLALADLLVEHPGGPGLPALAGEIIAGTRDADLFRSLVLQLAASRKEPLAEALARAAGHEFDRPRLAALAEALALAPRTAGTQAALADARERLPGLPQEP